ncbi:hypothetical protein [Enhygromyxa salina]|uniref:hypothetical protein n=1 Tax=Enhygromyxa salina TaxID=215803 RepID=UPI000D093DF3|nr:hypothetical protein [Enhygromyxa salina]
MIRRAISEAEGAIDGKAGFTSVLAAATQKRVRRSELATSERELLRQRLTKLLDEAERLWAQTGAAVSEQVEGIDVKPIRRANAKTRHYFRAQLLELALSRARSA